MKKVNILIKTPMQGYKANSVITENVDKDGVLLSKFWRRRIKDSKLDGCCEIVGQTPKSGKK